MVLPLLSQASEATFQVRANFERPTTALYSVILHRLRVLLTFVAETTSLNFTCGNDL